MNGMGAVMQPHHRAATTEYVEELRRSAIERQIDLVCICGPQDFASTVDSM